MACVPDSFLHLLTESKISIRESSFFLESEPSACLCSALGIYPKERREGYLDQVVPNLQELKKDKHP